MQFDTVLITGTPSSGTSALAGAFHDMGLYYGEDCKSGDPESYYEAPVVNRLNDEILAAADGEAWHRLPRRAVDPEPWTDRIRVAMQGRHGAKDPRIALTMPAWREAFPEAAVVVSYRHPLEVTTSLWNRMKVPAEDGLNLWIRTYDGLLRAADEWSERLFFIRYDLTDHERYLRDVREVGTLLGLPSPEANLPSIRLGRYHYWNRRRAVPEPCKELWDLMETLGACNV